jgi:DNA topoisomerase VI subunit B
MSAQEMLIEEIKHQPEEVAREVLRYLKFIERQREMESMESVVADTWEKLGPAPELDYDKL